MLYKNSVCAFCLDILMQALVFAMSIDSHLWVLEVSSLLSQNVCEMVDRYILFISIWNGIALFNFISTPSRGVLLCEIFLLPFFFKPKFLYLLDILYCQLTFDTCPTVHFVPVRNNMRKYIVSMV